MMATTATLASPSDSRSAGSSTWTVADLLAGVGMGDAAAWGELVPGTQMLGDAAASPSDPRAAEEFYLRTTAEPSLDVNGISGGSPVLQKTVLPVFAEANLSIRLAPGQDVEEIADAVERLMREAAPDGAELELTRLSAAAAGLVPPDAPAVQLAQEAFERTMGRRPLLVRSGGTLPIVPALVDKGIPTVVTGFAGRSGGPDLVEQTGSCGGGRVDAR